MSLFIASLNSGSNGNCYYVGNGEEAVLIDAGISCREAEKRMRRIGLSMNAVKAIFISHEHGDHISGIEGITNKHNIPVYITAPTLHHGRLRVQETLINSFRANEAITIGGLSVVAFPKLHDASDPHSFVVSGNGVRIGIFTDIGTPCTHVVQHFSGCHAAFLEANYDDAMLDAGRYPYHLKARIRGDHGHLSNRQAMELFIRHRPAYMSHLFLSHLSKDNNDPEHVRVMFNDVAGDTNIIIASRYNETAVYEICADANAQQEVRLPVERKIAEQISLF